MPAVIAAILAGVISNLAVVVFLCSLVKLDHSIVVSLLPKSTTTAMAIPLSENANGLVPLTTISVIITGILEV